MKQIFECARESASNLAARILHIPKKIGKAAFTLAEVLITLGIIGIVAALTMPTLIQNHQKQVYVTGLKKAYSNLQNAFAKMVVDEGVTELNQTVCANFGIFVCAGPFTLDSKDVCIDNLKKQFKVVNSSLSEIGSDYWGSLVSFVAADGIIYNIEYGDTSSIPDIGKYGGYNIGIKGIIVDINGTKGPDKFGRDKFEFYVDYSTNKIVPDGSGNPNNIKLCTTENVNKQSYSARYCTGKVLTEGKMDY